MFPQFDIGRSGENLVLYLIREAGFECELNEDYSKRYEYDLSVKMGKLKFTIECKHDVYSLRSGNIAVEIHNCKSDKPSGIYSTKADIWVYLIPTKDKAILAYAINTQKLILYTESTTPFKSTTASGDKNANLKIYKKEDILKEFIRFDNITDKKILKAVFAEMLL